MTVKTELAEWLPVHYQSARRDVVCRETSATDEMQCTRRVRLKETRRGCVSVFCVFLVSVPVKGFSSKPPTPAPPPAYIYSVCACACMHVCAAHLVCLAGAHSHSITSLFSAPFSSLNPLNTHPLLFSTSFQFL